MPLDLNAMVSHEELLTILTPIADNSVYVPQLIPRIESDLSVIPFVGAGMSVPFRLPAWGPFLESLAPDPETLNAVKALLADWRYEEAADYLYAIRGANSFQNVFGHTFRREALEGQNISAAVRFLAHFPKGPIVTTNFDAVLETVLKQEGASFSEVVTASHKDRLSEIVELNLNALIKLHGDAGDRDDRVLTFVEYERGYTTGPVRALIETLSSRCFLFLGCSLKTDRPAKVLTALAAEGRQLTQHFAVLEQPVTAAETRDRLKELTTIGIRPIFYPPTRHDLLDPLLELLASKTPKHRSRILVARRLPIYHYLPAPLDDIIGRETTLDSLQQDLARFRIVAVEGLRGIGKTTLVLHTLRSLCESDAFGALVWATASVVKSAFRVDDIVDAISLTLDFPFTPQTTSEEKEKITIDELTRKSIRCLIAIDNYENITDRDVDDFLTRRLPSNCTILITSAVAVPFHVSGMKVVSLEELPRDNALALFRHRAGERGVDQQLPNNLDRVHSLVGGNALAIEWVVGQMRAGRPLDTVLADIDQGQSEILGELFQSCWDLLGSDAHRILCAIAMFPFPPTQETLEAVCDLNHEACTTVIQQLRRLYLIKILNFGSVVALSDPQSRFVLHPITREFAEHHLALLQAEGFHSRAAAYFIDFVKQRGGTPELEEKQDLRALAQERANMLAVLERCRVEGADSSLVSLTFVLARWLFIEGHWSDLETWSSHAIDAALRIGDLHSAARLWAERGRMLSHRSQFRKADYAFSRSLILASADPPDIRTLGYLKHHMGETRIRNKHYAEARELLEESKAGFKQIRSQRDAIGVDYRLAVLALEEGTLDEARARFEHGIEDTIDEEWERLEGLHRRFLGELEIRWHPPDFEKARYQLERAARLITTLARTR